MKANTLHMKASAIHVWLDEPASVDGVKIYSVSIVDESGEELRHVDSYQSLARAWQVGKIEANRHRVTAIQFAGRTRQETGRWEPV